MYAIETFNLCKSYGSLEVLRDLNLQVMEGEVYGLLGPNGAGKSTLIHLLLGFLKPTSGNLRVLGESEPEDAHGRIGYLPERLRYHTRVTAREYLRFLGTLSDLEGTLLHERVESGLARVGLSDAADRRLGTYSKGMLQRLGVAQALLSDPALLLFDEPTSGLDPGGQHEVLEVIADLRAHGHTILLCTHQLHEAEYLCDRVGILVRGRLATEVDVQVLSGQPHSVGIKVDALEPAVRGRLEELSSGVHCEERQIVLRPSDNELQRAVMRELVEAGITILAVNPLERPLEQIYLRAVNNAPNDPENVTRLVKPRVAMPEPVLSLVPEEASKPATEQDPLLHELLRRSGLAPDDEEPPDQAEADQAEADQAEADQAEADEVETDQADPSPRDAAHGKE